MASGEAPAIGVGRQRAADAEAPVLDEGAALTLGAETEILEGDQGGSVANSDTVSKIGLMYCQGQLR